MARTDKARPKHRQGGDAGGGDGTTRYRFLQGRARQAAGRDYQELHGQQHHDHIPRPIRSGTGHHDLRGGAAYGAVVGLSDGDELPKTGGGKVNKRLKKQDSGK